MICRFFVQLIDELAKNLEGWSSVVVVVVVVVVIVVVVVVSVDLDRGQPIFPSIEKKLNLND